MMEVSSQIIINAPLDKVFTYYSDQDRLQEWIPGNGILEFTPLTPAPKRPGSRYHMAYRSMGVTFRLVTELTKLQKNRLSAMEQVTGDFKAFHYEMDFAEASPSTTSLKMTIRGALPWGIIGAVAELLTRSQVSREINGVLRRFKSGAESVAFDKKAS
jgi:uncharacterized membrane protein